MNLLQIIVPPVDTFFIYPKRGIHIPIAGYNKIDINFRERKAFKDGKAMVLTSPVISYFLRLDADSKDKLGILFSDCRWGNECTLTTKRSRIKIGKESYVFGVNITARPDMRESFLLKGGGSDLIKVSLELENEDINIFEEVDMDMYRSNWSNRFDILDL